MAPTSCFEDDAYVTYNRNCLVFPADGSEPRLVQMTIRTVTDDDFSNIRVYNRAVDLRPQYGREYRKIRLAVCPSQLGPAGGDHVLHFNLSPKLPLNRCVARIVGLNPDQPGHELFWRGDVVVMSIEYEPRGDPYIICNDAGLSVADGLAEMLRDWHSKGRLDQELVWDEEMLKLLDPKISQGFPTTIGSIIGSYNPFGGKSRREKEETAHLLNHVNELREFVGRDPILGTSVPVGGIFDLLALGRTTIHNALPWFCSFHRPKTRLPVFPFKVERQIFEICARSNRSTCITLVLVARRVRRWVEPILFETVVLDLFTKSSTSPSLKFGLFMANIDNRSLEFYSEHVKNLWISAPDDPDAFERMLTICSSVENLVLFAGRRSMNLPFIPFLQSPDAGSCLRRLTCKLEVLFPPWSEATAINFNHRCFTNLTHLHLYDEMEDWSNYTGFEHLRSLTHFALACCGPEALATIMPKLPALQYVALCSHKDSQYGRPTVNRSIPIDVYGNKVVWLDGVTIRDWKRGVAGEGDFWDVVKAEVDRRLLSAGQQGARGGRSANRGRGSKHQKSFPHNRRARHG